MNYSQVLTYLYEQLPMFQRQGPIAFKKDLGNIRKLCSHLDDPQNDQQFIHIAGTNGKGSTAHILASLLQAHGYKVGLYTSPHYKDFRERIKINAALIPKRTVSSFVTKHKNFFQEIEPSFFEITVALAFWYFKKEKVDFAIIETGLGGRLDSTNIIQPLLSVITNIGLDHQNMLGDTLLEIASEKAGIIKPEVPVLIGEYQRNLVRLFRDKAKKEKAPIFFSKDILAVEGDRGKNGGLKLEVKFRNLQVKFSGISSDMGGTYQLKNIQTALAAYSLLPRYRQLKFSKQKVIQGLKKISKTTNFLGRWMQLGKQPLIIADSAHNVDGIKNSVNQLSAINYKKLHIVFGTVTDKEPTDVLKLLPKSALFYFAKADIPRGMNAQELKLRASLIGITGKAFSTVNDAFDAAKNEASKKDLILILGSIFAVAEVI